MSIFSEHILNFPEIKTPITDDCKKDLWYMMSLADVIAEVERRGTIVFNKIYAEKLSHLLLIGKLKIAEPRTWLNDKLTYSGRVVDVLRLCNSGYYTGLYTQNKVLSKTITATLQQVFDLQRDDSIESIYITNLIECLSKHYNDLMTSKYFFRQIISHTDVKNRYFKQLVLLLIESLRVAKDKQNNINIVFNDYENNDCKEMQETFIDWVLGSNTIIGGCPNFLYVTNNVETNYYRNIKQMQFIEQPEFIENALSLVIIDFSKLSSYNTGKESMEAILKELYIDGQGLNQLKRYTRPDDKKSLVVRVENVPKQFKDIVYNVLTVETDRLKNAYADDFKFEVKYIKE